MVRGREVALTEPENIRKREFGRVPESRVSVRIVQMRARFIGVKKVRVAGEMGGRIRHENTAHVEYPELVQTRKRMIDAHVKNKQAVLYIAFIQDKINSNMLCRIERSLKEPGDIQVHIGCPHRSNFRRLSRGIENDIVYTQDRTVSDRLVVVISSHCYRTIRTIGGHYGIMSSA